MKKLLSIILSAIMLLALAAPVSAIVMAEEEDIIDEDGNVIHYGGVIVDNPYAALYAEFFENGKYPDDFAGVWVENNETMYVFALVDGTDASKYEAVLGDYAGQYRFEYMQYSYNTLLHIRDAVFERVKDIISGAGVYQQENKIYFDVWVDEAEENGRIAEAVLDIKNEENLPDGIENAFSVEYGIAYAVDEESEYDDDGAVAEYSSDGIDWAAENRASESAHALIGFAYDNSGNILRDDYAGSWYDRDTKRLVAAVTEDGDTDAYRELFKGYDNVDVVTRKYPLKALHILQDEVFDRLFDIMSSAGTMVMENSVDFMVRIDADEARQLILQAMTEVKNEYGLPDGIENAFTVEYGLIIPATDDGSAAENNNPGTGIALAALSAVIAAVCAIVTEKK